MKNAMFILMVFAVLFISACAARPVNRFAVLTPEGWRVEEDVAAVAGGLQVDELEFVPVLEACEFSVTGAIMRQRAVQQQTNIGLADGMKMFFNQSAIPADMRDKKIVFAGTLFSDSDGDFYVAYLFWDDSWRVGFESLNRDWGSGSRFPRLRK